jgi:mitochondrial fusion and transport protein UGO1
MSDTSEDSYFQDPSGTHSGASRFVPEPKVPRITDEDGYVVRRSIVEDGTRPEYVIPIGPQDGVWGMVKRVGRFQTEGWLGLWKGKIFHNLS